MKVKRFNYNDLDLVEKAFEIRRKVFIQEQKVKDYEEFDEFENSSVHYMATDVSDQPLGTARWRVTPNGIKLERFAVLREHRKAGLGGLMLNAMLKEIPLDVPIYLHAQVSAVDFYKKHGFESTGNRFTECEIQHYKMTYANSRQTRLTLTETINHVHNFHRAFGLNMEFQPTTDIAPNLIDLRHRLMHEENEEYFDAARAGDLTEVADALGDMLYILCGTIITHGLQNKIGEVFEEIQRSNMSKLDANGKPIYREDGKVMKSNLYFKPDIGKILNGH